MRLAIYVPKAQAELWTPDATNFTFDSFQLNVIDLCGGLSLTSAVGKWAPPGNEGYIEEPVFIVETFLLIPNAETYRKAWGLFRSYATQLIAQGEESVLIVQDNEPTLITA